MTGNSLEAVKGSGRWRGSGFLSYEDLEMDHAFRISRALNSLTDSDYSDEGGPPARSKRIVNAVEMASYTR